ncbi:MAG: phosphoglycerate kinase, partial [bacterium]
QMFSDVIMRSGTLIWNGPMGVFEVPSFATGTFRLAEVAAHAAKEGSCVILGGGDSSAAAKAAGVLEEMTHVSTGGGATLELLSGKTLPGFEALSNEQERK